MFINSCAAEEYEETTTACNIEPEKGICNLPKSYYFDKDDKICREYSPLECKGNQNKFSTEEKCLKKDIILTKMKTFAKSLSMEDVKEI